MSPGLNVCAVVPLSSFTSSLPPISSSTKNIESPISPLLYTMSPNLKFLLTRLVCNLMSCFACKSVRALYFNSIDCFVPEDDVIYLLNSSRETLITSTGVAHLALVNRLFRSSSRLPSPKKSPCRRIETICPLLVVIST